MQASRTRGDLCPGALRPWPADDGLLIRLRLIGGAVFPGWPVLLSPVLEAALWPIVSVLLLAPQRRAPNPDANRPP